LKDGDHIANIEQYFSKDIRVERTSKIEALSIVAVIFSFGHWVQWMDGRIKLMFQTLVKER